MGKTACRAQRTGRGRFRAAPVLPAATQAEATHQYRHLLAAILFCREPAVVGEISPLPRRSAVRAYLRPSRPGAADAPPSGQRPPHARKTMPAMH